MKIVLAMDLGTTGNRVLAFSKQGNVVAKAYYEFTQYYPKPGWVEHDAMEIWQTALKALRQTAKKAGVNNIQAIGITNQRETAVLWDKTTGKPVSKAIVWQCRRTADMCRRLKGAETEVKAKTGLFIDPYFSATKIRWILDNVPGVKKRVSRGNIAFGTIDTWILWNLTRGKVFATEPSNASRTLVFNIKTMNYDPRLMKIFGVPEEILPEIRQSGGSFGVISKEILGKEIPVTAILGDQQASLYAQGGWQPGVVKNTYGTGLFVMTGTGSHIAPSGKLINTVAWSLDGKPHYALEGSIFIGGAAVQWLRDGLKIIKSARDSEKLAGGLKHNEGVYFVPALAGLGAPYWDPSARGLIIGLTRGTDARHLVRAALESLAYQTRDVVDEMKKVCKGIRFEKLRVDGGAAENGLLMQFQADILGIKVEKPVHTETTVFGAAGLAGVTSGFWTQKDLLNIQKSAKVYKPKMKSAERNRFYAKWKEAAGKALQWE